MTKKHFEFMAKLVWIYSVPETPERDLLLDIMTHLGQRFNDLFDPVRFEAYVEALDNDNELK
jgi:hypothetical protein